VISGPLLAGTRRIWRTSTIWWPLGWFLYVFGVGWAVILISETFDMATYLRTMPAQFLGAFGIEVLDTGGDKYLGVLYYLTTEIFGPGVYMMAIFAAFLAPSLVAREVDQGTLDTLLSRPITRRQYIWTRFAHFGLVAVAMGAAVLAGAVISFGLIGGYEIPWRGFLIVAVLFTLGCLAFGGVAFAVSAAALSTSAGAIAVFVALAAMVLLNVFRSVADWLDVPARVSFFAYWRPTEVLIRQHVDPAAPLVFAGVAIVFAVAAAEIFHRRDLV